MFSHTGEMYNQVNSTDKMLVMYWDVKITLRVLYSLILAYINLQCHNIPLCILGLLISSF